MPLHLYNREGRPGMLRRQCTRYFKLDPIRWRIRALCAEVGVKHVIQQIGISLEEAAQRMRSSDVHYITNVYPLVDLRMTRWDCRNSLVRRGYPLWAKSSCIGCPYRTDWRAMNRERPEE